MPLVRVEVRSEFGLGAPEVYTNANKEDPKAVLEGVAVAGLVGILRQLGDLAEFAAEVFHGLQEQVMITSSRSHKLMERAQRIEAALPPLEKLVLSQRSHLHFAYTSGASWHSRLRSEQNHFIYNDLPRFIMDSYELCRGPPHLNLLDKFDPGGPGSCLKRYSDPSFFRRASSKQGEAHVDKILKNKKGRKFKQRITSFSTGVHSRAASFSTANSRMQVSSPRMDGRRLPFQAFTSHSDRKMDLGEQSVYSGSRYWSGDLDHLSSYSMNNGEQDYNESYSSSARMPHKNTNGCDFVDDRSSVLDDMRSTPSVEEAGPSPFCVTSDGKSEILETAAMEYDHEELRGTFSIDFDFNGEESGAAILTSKEPDNLENLETLEMTFNGEAEDKGAHDHDYTEETLSTKAEDKGANDHDYSEETLSTNFDLATQGIGAANSGAALDYNLDQGFENISPNFYLETQDGKVTHVESVDLDFLDGDELSMPLSSNNLLEGSESADMSSQRKVESLLLTGDDHHHEVESEAENYVDALNSIESEYDTDVDGQTKQEEEQPDFDKNVVDSGLDIFTSVSMSHSSNYETRNITSTSHNDEPELPETSSGEGEKAEVISNLLPLELPGSIHSPQISSNHLDSGSTQEVGSCDTVESLLNSKDTTSNSHDIGASGLPETCHGEKQSSEILSNSSSLEFSGFIQSPQIASHSLDSGHIQDVGLCANVDGPISTDNSVITRIPSGPAESLSGVPDGDRTTSSNSELDNASPQHSIVTPVKLWTNGGLLGLEPSKPPDFSLLNVSTQVSQKDNNYMIGPSTAESKMTEKSCSGVEGKGIANFSTSSQDDRKGGIFMKKASWLFSSADLGANLQKLSDPSAPSYADTWQKNGKSETHGSVQPVTPDIHSPRNSQENSSNSSRMLELGNRLFMNGFHRKPSLDRDDNFTSTSSNAGVFEKDIGQKVDNQIPSERSKNMLRSRSPFVSPPSSPPLGHMKISFHPVNGYEAQLQLKFSDGTVSRESDKDTFPSFQLVPEPTVPLRDAVSDSEDDTFCRSSAYGSDCLSYQSDLNSELWESDASPSTNNHELYDSLHGISFSESAITSWNTETLVQGDVNNNYRTQNSLSRGNVEYSQSDHIYDLPSLDLLQISVMERKSHELKNHVEPLCAKEAAPSPPPLPLPQWQARKPLLESEENIQFVVTENTNSSFDGKFGSAISQQPKPAPVTQEHIIEASQTFKSKKTESQRASRQKEVNQAVYQKDLEEKDDFLHQIRTKSFNLRRTSTAKPAAAAVPLTSVQVTALLKKANEIRQAVGSDGEDDAWSDA
ncbi:OLC1v1021330C2 [Oldenlandia corymbosa var. corymbosa]|uniref:Protein SCAR n=1 Tax=Oldenlandia corymbosa var. corymbosa TaxID=529605 RepID=A0AAV1BWX5_OLDCO|nr:OLC1v1021330C2 [Oldenlandia corymbosa var. corymbosa]